MLNNYSIYFRLPTTFFYLGCDFVCKNLNDYWICHRVNNQLTLKDVSWLDGSNLMHSTRTTPIELIWAESKEKGVLNKILVQRNA